MLLAATTGLAGNFDAGAALGAGLLGGIAFLAVVVMGRAIGMTRMNFLHVLGSMMAPDASSGVVYTIGLMAHLMASAVFGVAHAGLLHAVDPSSVGTAVGWDLVIGAVHGAIILMVLPMMLTAMHPLVRRRAMEQPGPALTGFGRGTPVGSFMAHVVFGAVAGAVYASIVL